MKQLLTANVASSMYWLGRYLERVEATLFEINKAYDCVIDVDKNAGAALYKKFDIDLAYTGAIDFLDKAIFGDHSANLANIMTNARENAIISRSTIDASFFGEIIELHEHFQCILRSPNTIDYQDIDKALSLLFEIWGTHTKRGDRKYSDYFFRLGRLTEELDFRLRFDRGHHMTKIIIKEINLTFKILNPDLDLKLKMSQLNNDKKGVNIMTIISQNMEKLIIT